MGENKRLRFFEVIWKLQRNLRDLELFLKVLISFDKSREIFKTFVAEKEN